MPVEGLTLIGFMDQQGAANYLQNRCLLPDNSPPALQQHWQTAQQQLGAASPNAGQPDIQDIPAQHLPYLQQVMNNPRFTSTVDGATTWAFKLIEVDPLLAFQYHVELDRSNQLCGPGVQAADIATVLPITLPHGLENITHQISVQQNGFLVKSPSLNLRLHTAGQLGNDPAQHLLIAGIAYGPSSPLIQVVRFNGKCYLKNGYHRAYGLRVAGATHMPCLFMEATDFGQVGVAVGGGTFDRPILESANPPTVGHFTQGRAYQVLLRRMTRIIHLSWSEFVLPDET